MQPTRLPLQGCLGPVETHRLEKTLHSRRIAAQWIERKNHTWDAADDFPARDWADKAGVSAVIAGIAQHEVLVRRHDERAEIP